MNKSEVLQSVSKLAKSGKIKKDELLNAFNKGVGGHSHFKMANILYYIGAAIVFMGIVILVGQNWDLLNDFTRILVSLGSSIAAFIAAILIGQKANLKTISLAFFLISMLIMPVGFAVTFDIFAFDIGDVFIQVLMSTMSLIIAVLALAVFKNDIFLIFSIVFGTWLYFALTDFLFEDSLLFDKDDFWNYRMLILGLSYLFIGYSLMKDKKNVLSNFLYAFGTLFFLGAALFLSGWEPEQNVFWEIIFPGLAFAVIFLSTYLKRLVFLIIGSGALIIYIFKITSEYFTDSLGWPLSLVIIGLSLIAVGYLFVHLNKKYIKG